jgi:hypothetical protein
MLSNPGLTSELSTITLHYSLHYLLFTVTRSAAHRHVRTVTQQLTNLYKLLKIRCSNVVALVLYLEERAVRIFTFSTTLS